MTQLMQVHVKGRLEAVRTYEGVRYTRIMTPAPDPYSKPQILEVRSKKSLGSRGEEVEFLARLGGVTRAPFNVTDKETGEITRVIPVALTLDLIED